MFAIYICPTGVGLSQEGFRYAQIAQGAGAGGIPATSDKQLSYHKHAACVVTLGTYARYSQYEVVEGGG